MARSRNWGKKEITRSQVRLMRIFAAQLWMYASKLLRAFVTNRVCLCRSHTGTAYSLLEKVRDGRKRPFINPVNPLEQSISITPELLAQEESITRQARPKINKKNCYPSPRKSGLNILNLAFEFNILTILFSAEESVLRHPFLPFLFL